MQLPQIIDRTKLVVVVEGDHYDSLYYDGQLVYNVSGDPLIHLLAAKVIWFDGFSYKAEIPQTLAEVERMIAGESALAVEKARLKAETTKLQDALLSLDTE